MHLSLVSTQVFEETLLSPTSLQIVHDFVNWKRDFSKFSIQKIRKIFQGRQHRRNRINPWKRLTPRYPAVPEQIGFERVTELRAPPPRVGVIPIDIHRGRDTSTANNEFIGAQTQIPGKPVRGKIQVDRESEFRMRNAEFASRHSRQPCPAPWIIASCRSPRVKVETKGADLTSFPLCISGYEYNNLSLDFYYPRDNFVFSWKIQIDCARFTIVWNRVKF